MDLAFLPEWQLPHGYSTVCMRLTVVRAPNIYVLLVTFRLSDQSPRSLQYSVRIFMTSHSYYTLCDHFVTGLMGIAITTWVDII